MTFQQRINSIDAHGIITKIINVPGSRLISKFLLYPLLLMTDDDIVLIIILSISYLGQLRLKVLKQLVQVP